MMNVRIIPLRRDPAVSIVSVRLARTVHWNRTTPAVHSASHVPVSLLLLAIGVDCASLYRAGARESGVYMLQPDPADNTTKLAAYCDMKTAGGGWTVIQRRVDGSEDFFRSWRSYKQGFGSLLHDYWLGLDSIHRLTKFGNTHLRVGACLFTGNTHLSVGARLFTGNTHLRVGARLFTGNTHLRVGARLFTGNTHLRVGACVLTSGCVPACSP